jgi:hypothetical protein
LPGWLTSIAKIPASVPTSTASGWFGAPSTYVIDVISRTPCAMRLPETSFQLPAVAPPSVVRKTCVESARNAFVQSCGLTAIAITFAVPGYTAFGAMPPVSRLM